ncbi:hypothetical protein L3V31_17860 [Vibrio sp. J1-1]|uniref:hypothetical protein n=1 Tax=Vibrio sp. J1-1 TaxID=2912251 RepID=UPI001F41BCD3|nr:hypothetical protein [Vibrio sp. J1-1]MCF7483572.1 hypothetical protein [Vibrio sp. J1-1]
MSKLIEVNSKNPSIKFIDFGNLRLVAYEASSDYIIRVSFFSGGVYFSQETPISPCQLQHTIERESDGKANAVLRDTDDYRIYFTIVCERTYKAVCELFSMPVNDDVIRAFECEA